MEENEAERVRALGRIVVEFDLDALRVKHGELEYELIRREPAAANAAPLVYAPYPGSSPAPAPVAGPEPGAASATAIVPANVKKVSAPVVGVFYSAPSPGADPFVSVGDRVQVGQTLCILEAMKLMNEITTDHGGTVTRIIPQNGELVTLGEDLFWIEP